MLLSDEWPARRFYSEARCGDARRSDRACPRRSFAKSPAWPWRASIARTIGAGLGLGERLAVPVVVLSDEAREVAPQIGPLRQRPGQEPAPRGVARGELERGQHMRHAQAVRRLVGLLELGIVDEAQRGLKIPLLGMGQLGAGRADDPPAVDPDDGGRPGPTPRRARSRPKQRGGARGGPGCGSLEASADHPQEVLAEDRRAECRVRGLPEHPGVPAAQSPRGAQAGAAHRVGHVLVEEGGEVAMRVRVEAAACRASRLRRTPRSGDESR